MAQKSWLISHTGAVLAGLTLGSTGLLTANATTVPQSRPASVCTDIDSGQTGKWGALQTLRGQIASEICDEAEAEAGLDADDCVTADLKVTRLVYTADNVKVCGGFEWSGNWVKD